MKTMLLRSVRSNPFGQGAYIVACKIMASADKSTCIPTGAWHIKNGFKISFRPKDPLLLIYSGLRCAVAHNSQAPVQAGSWHCQATCRS